MALPTNSAGPDAPTDSTAIDGLLGLGLDAQEIRNWLVALSPSGGVYDTGWTNITLASGFTSTLAPQCRRIGNVVYWRGRIETATGSFTAGTEVQIGTVPAGFFPTRSWADGFMPAWLNVSSGPCGLSAQPDGSLKVRVPAGVTGATQVIIAGLHYALS